MSEEQKKINYPRKIARIVLKTVLFIFLFVVLLFILVFTPPVQHFITGKVQSYLQDKLKTKVVIGSISFGLSGKINLENVFIEDKTKDTLVSGGTIKAHLNYLKLFSNEVEVKDIELQNITAKIKRIYPDTVFNYQFIVDAFTSEQTKKPDTAKSAPLKLNISDIALDNVYFTFKDDVSGSDVFAHFGTFFATMDTLDPYTQHFDIPTIIARNVQARVRQYKPLATPKPLAVDVAKAATPAPPMKLNIGTIDLTKIGIQYENELAALFTNISIGQLKTKERLLDITNNRIYLDQLTLNNSKAIVRMGKQEAVKEVAEVGQKVQAKAMTGIDVRIAHVQFDNNLIQYDNDNAPRLLYGMDYNHIRADNLTLYANNFVMNNDSTGLVITRGSVREKSGLRIDALQGDLLYAAKEAHLKNLYIKTPGSQIQKNLVLTYPSINALTKNPAQVALNIDLSNTRLQVRDILAFAPQLRSNPAMSNPDAIWNLDIVGNGTLNDLHLETLRFDGLRNTHLNAQGTLVALMNPKQAGGNFTIYRFHTTQSDIALFNGGKRLSNKSINFPEDIDVSGTVKGNSGQVYTMLSVNTSAGYLGVNGEFSNLTDPNRIGYNATLQTRNLQVGTIMRQPQEYGALSATIRVNGRGSSPNNIVAKFDGTINSAGYNHYQYHNIHLNGSVNKSDVTVAAVSRDPNLSLNLTASASLTSNPSFKVNGMIDSVKTMPLHFTTDPMVFRGHIDATVSNLTGDNMDADVLITKGLFVSNGNRVPLDTVQLVSGRNDTANYITLRSNVANANLVGQYRLTDLGNIIQNTLEPYFSVAPTKAATVAPYDFHFTADVVYSPVLVAFMPGLTAMQPIHASGRFATGQGMNATVTSAYIDYNGNEITNLNVRAFTSENGLHVSGNVGHLKSGSSFDLYNTRVNATALHNNIDFNFGTDDPNGRNKYYLSGTVTQPSNGTYAIKLRPDSLLLNYERWTVPADNSITITTTNILANDFSLQKGNQRLTLQSLAASAGAQPLQLNFTNFRLATLTGFVKSDSLLVDGTMNGNVTFRNILKQPVFTSDLTIDNFSMRQDTLGTVRVQANSTATDRYNLNLTLNGRGNDVALTGSFAPAGKDLALDMNLNVRNLELHSMEGAMASAITNASGAVNGTIRITGTSAKPVVNGDLNFNKASFALTPLGSQFKIDNEKITVTQDGFVFNNFTIHDSANNALTINGNILTNNFINYNFNLDVTANNFMALNSTKAQNKLYYGKLNISSNLHIAGTEVKPVVSGTLAVNKGTNLSIVVPEAEPGVEDRQGIVEFVDMKAPENDTLFKRYDSLNKATGTLGMDIAVNISVNKEAIFNVIVDPANGDFLNVQGEANLSTGIDPSGKITMVGTYRLERGSYQLAFNFIQRKFDITKGSTITWTGDPTSAILDVHAVYIANTAPLDLVSDQISASNVAIRNTYLQKLPFEVHLDLSGELMKPSVAFDIVLPEDKNYGVSNDIVTTVESKLDQLRQDQGEINKQVFALLLLGRFVGQNPFQSSGSGGFDVADYARQSVSKLLTDQLNNLASGLINGVDINFDVASTDDYTTGSRRSRTDLNIGLSKRLLSDRLKVTVGSNFELQGPQNSNQQNNNIAGNIAADYQISKDGRYMLRFYRRNEYEGIVDGYIVETGIGFIFTVDYNKFTEILHRKKQRVTTANGTKQNTSGQ